MTSWKNISKGWVFISHSSQDYEDVKIVRNYLEESGFSALMFYLKSLEDPKKSILTQKLINWEIEARNIFVLCNSKNAKKSKWVQDEIKYVKSFPDKIYVEIDIDKLKYEKCTQLSKLDRLIFRSKLFFSYSFADKEIVDRVYRFLSSKGFEIWFDSDSLNISDNFSTVIENVIKDVGKKGIILVFLSKNSINSKWMWEEVNLAIELNAFILPIIIDEIDVSQIKILQNRAFLDLTKGNFKKNMQKLLLIIKNLYLR